MISTLNVDVQPKQIKSCHWLFGGTPLDTDVQRERVKGTYCLVRGTYIECNL